MRNGPGQIAEEMRRALDAPGQALRMPAFRDRLSDAELEAVLAYIKTW